MSDVEKIKKSLEVSPAFSRDYFSGGEVRRFGILILALLQQIVE